MHIDVLYLELANGKSPFLEWEKKLDTGVRATIRIRINRIRLADYGDCKSIKGTSGLYELRIHVGPGYRIYFGKIKETLVIILSAGDKSLKSAISTRPKIIGDYIKNRSKNRKKNG